MFGMSKKLTLDNGTIIEGKFKNGLKKGKITFPDGRVELVDKS